MALNQKYNDGVQFDVAAADVTAPAEPESGDAVLIGQIPAVALTSPFTDGDGVSRITVKTNGAYHLEVTASNGAVTVGALLYIHTSTGAVSNTSGSGVRFGYALDAVDSAATTTIPVKLGY